MSEIHALFVIGLMAVLAPLLARHTLFSGIPVVALELVLGILIGPSGANWVSSQGAIGFLGEFGLLYLFFQAGFEFNRAKIGLEPLKLAAFAWVLSVGLTATFVALMSAAGLLRAPLLVGIAMPTTAFGILIAMLKENGDIDTEFGHYVLATAVIGELGPLILSPILLAHAHEHLHETMFVITFLLAAIGATTLAKSARSEALAQGIARWMKHGSILPLRISILILLGLISLANELGMEIVFGAYTAGAVIAILIRDTAGEILEDRLVSVGSGFLVPLFFITSGVEFDIHALLSSPANLARLFSFTFGLLAIRIVPVCLFRRILPERDLIPLALYSSTTLPLVVAITYLGVRTGHMLPENASALVGAAILSVTLFPIAANWLRAQPEDARVSFVPKTICTICDIATARISRYVSFLSKSETSSGGPS